jgi:hypothetical protein
MPVLTVRKNPGELCGDASAAAGVIGCWNDAWDSSAGAGSRGIGGSISLSAAVDGTGTAGCMLAATSVLIVAGLLLGSSAAGDAESVLAMACSGFGADERLSRTISWLPLMFKLL